MLTAGETKRSRLIEWGLLSELTDRFLRKTIVSQDESLVHGNLLNMEQLLENFVLLEKS